MKKAFLIISTLLIIFLAGCGLFNLNSWICPDDLEFIKLIGELNTPQKIGDYMINNFIYKLHNLWTPDPYTLWKIKKGDCNDFATFGIFMAYRNDIEVAQIIIHHKDPSNKHALAVYVENGGLSFTDNQYYNPCLHESYRFNIIKEIVDYDCLLRGKVWIKYVVYDYGNNVVEVGYK